MLESRQKILWQKRSLQLLLGQEDEKDIIIGHFKYVSYRKGNNLFQL